MTQAPIRQAAASLEADLGRFFALSPDMLCTVGFDGRFVECNSSLAAGMGVQPGELIGRPVNARLHLGDEPFDAWSPGTSVVLEVAHVHEGRYLHADNEYRWLSWNVRADIERKLYYCSVRDITDRREQAAIVDKLLVELERSNTDLAQFAYVASHDLSEPLRMVSSYVQLLASRYVGQLDADADEFIAYAVDGAARMKVLIDDLLEYSRSGGNAPIRRRVDTGALLRSTLADLDVAINEIDAVVDVADDLPVVSGDPAQLSLVFHNLVSNALKFVEPDTAPRVRVSAARGDDEWCFRVEDNGIGIPEAHRKRIFLMFKRLHGRADYPGTGIGLALCHKIVLRLGGRIWLEDPMGSGEGSVFCFSVPDGAPTEVV